VTLNRIACEGLVLLYKPYVVKEPEFILGAISELEQKIDQEQDPNFSGDLHISNIMVLGSML